MKRYQLLVWTFLFFVLCASSPLLAADADTKLKRSKPAPALLAPRAEKVAAWKSPLMLLFEPARKACTEAYGKEGEALCAQNLGLVGKKVDDVRISPAIEGEWRWDTDKTLRFSPTKGWRADTAYIVTFPPNLLGARGKSLNTQLKFRTEALKAQVQTAEFLFDPEALNAKILQGTLSFNYPVEMESAQALSAFVLDTAAYKDGALQEKGRAFVRENLAAPEFIWNEDATGLTVSSVVRHLDDQKWTLLLRVGKGIRSDFSGAPLARVASHRVELPSRLGFMTAERIELRWVPGETLNENQEIWISFNAPLHSAEVNKKLQLRLLPEKRDPKAEVPTKWNEVPFENLLPAEIAAAPVLPVTPVLAADARERTHRFRLNVPQGRYVLVSLEKGLNNGEYTFEQAQQALLKVDAPSYALDFMQKGTMLSLAGEKKISLHSKNLDRIDWEINRVLPQNLHLLFSENWNSALNSPTPQASYTSLSTLATGSLVLNPDSKKTVLSSAKAGKAQFSVLDLAPFVGGQKYGILSIFLRGYSGDKQVMAQERFVVVSDLGLIVKENTDASRTVFVASLSQGRPCEKVEISVLGANGQPVVTTQSNAQGEAQLPSLKGFTRDKAPSVLVARLGEDLALLPLNDLSLTVYSQYQGGGMAATDGMNAYVFSQRELYRPGEKVHFGVLVRQPHWKENPSIPLKALLTDPMGNRVLEKTFTLTSTGLSELSWDSPENTLAGLYTLDIAVSKKTEFDTQTLVLGSTQVRVEEFSPQTMRMDIALEPHRAGWVTPDAVRAVVTLKNLYGKIAANNRVQGVFRFLPTQLSFPGFEDYTFDVPRDGAEKSAPKLYCSKELEATTNAEGQARFSMPKDAPSGTWSLVFEANGFESGGGRSVQGMEMMLVSSLKTMLGFKTRDALDYLRKGTAAQVKIIALNAQCTPTRLGGLQSVIYERQLVNTLVRTPRGEYRYDTVEREKEIRRQGVIVEASGLNLPLETRNPGDYVLVLENEQGQRVLSIPYFVAGLMPRDFNSSTEPTLRLRLDKKEYHAGETIELALTAPYDGYGLITLERDTVNAFVWFQSRAGDSTQRIAIPADFDGKGYVHVSFARAAGSPDIFLSPYVSAVQPFQTSVQRHNMQLNLKAPAKVLPGEDLVFTLSAKDKGMALVFLADEGILRMTEYKTPSPLDYFLLDRGLDVQTCQIFSLMMPEYAAIRQAYAAAFGGGGDMLRAMAAMDGRSNPFKRKAEPPVQHWWGLVAVDTTERSFTFKVPDYFNGQLRLMAVGSSDAKAGSAVAESTVQGDIVISPQLPLAVAIGDSFEGVAVISNTTAEKLELGLSVDAGARLRLRKAVPATITLEPSGELRVPLLLETAANNTQEAGENTVRISVKKGENTFVRAMSLSVRPASPFIRAVQTGYLPKAGQRVLNRVLYSQNASVSAAVSSVPLPAAQGLAAYLSTYPYGCTEQRISRAFPWLVLLPYPELLPIPAGVKPEDARAKGQEMVQDALNTIQSRMSHEAPEGRSVASWPDTPGDALLTVYAFDFLLTARQAGYAVSQQTFEQLAADLEKISLQNATSLSEARAQAYALWLLTRYGEVTATQIWSLKANLDENMPGWKSDLTAAFLGASLRMMQLDKPAEEFMAAAMPSLKQLWTQEGFFDGLAVQSLYLTLISSFPEMLQDSQNAAALRQQVKQMLDRIASQEYSSFSAAQATRALVLYAASLQAQASSVGIACQDAAGASLELHPSGTLIRSVDNALCSRFEFSPENPETGFYWQIYSQGFDKKMPAALNQGMEVQRVYVQADGTPAGTIRQGDEITVQIKARAYGQPRAQCAITDMLPGGFEMVLDNATKNRPMPLRESSKNPDTGCPFMPVQYTQPQEDRMLIFTPLGTEAQQFVYKIRAVSIGNFALPPVYAEDMYNPAVRSNSAAGRITVGGLE